MLVSECLWRVRYNADACSLLSSFVVIMNIWGVELGFRTANMLFHSSVLSKAPVICSRPIGGISLGFIIY